MSFRITTNGMFHSYRGNLSRSTKNLYDSMTRLQTERYFNSYAEDPAAANRAFQARRSYWNTGNQIDNSNYLISKFQNGWDSLKSVIGGDVDNPGLDGILESLRGITGTAGAGRTSLGQTLLSTAEAIVAAMNARYGDEYIFAGADGLNPPFSWKTETDNDGNVVKKLYYRGYSVDDADPDNEDDAIVKMNKETTLVDIGLGFRLQVDKDGNLTTEINPATAYDSSVSGAEILGFGMDEDGVPMNLVSIMQELGEIFSRCNPDSGSFMQEGDQERAEVLVGKLRSAVGRVQEQHVKLDGRSTYLLKNLDQLQDNKLNLNEEIERVERMDMAAAIGDMMWAQYSYNAALRIGGNILSQSLFDYLG